ncbi:unnamed protein product [Arabis nemorensis]|uniref:Flotillin-like n=1 Tax=Arabis nemorensis TaxID=586526 RepID=A0A565BMH6_9BRAS|nr:unnamed protein product [Arabis nemorensis]
MEAANKAKVAEIDAESKIISTKRLVEGTKEEIEVKTIQVFKNQKDALVAEAKTKQEPNWEFYNKHKLFFTRYISK